MPSNVVPINSVPSSSTQRSVTASPPRSNISSAQVTPHRNGINSNTTSRSASPDKSLQASAPPSANVSPSRPIVTDSVIPGKPSSTNCHHVGSISPVKPVPSQNPAALRSVLSSPSPAAPIEAPHASINNHTVKHTPIVATSVSLHNGSHLSSDFDLVDTMSHLSMEVNTTGTGSMYDGNSIVDENTFDDFAMGDDGGAIDFNNVQLNDEELEDMLG